MEIFWKRRFFKLWFFWNGEFLEVEIFLRVGIFCSVEILLNDGIRLRWKIFFTNVWRCRLCNVDKKREKDKRGWKDRRWMKPVLTYYEPIVLVYCVQNKYTRIKKNRKSCDEIMYQSRVRSPKSKSKCMICYRFIPRDTSLWIWILLSFFFVGTLLSLYIFSPTHQYREFSLQNNTTISKF